jgi:hypothetical protein
VENEEFSRKPVSLISIDAKITHIMIHKSQTFLIAK